MGSPLTHCSSRLLMAEQKAKSSSVKLHVGPEVLHFLQDVPAPLPGSQHINKAAL
jgi:hypothetical protein